MYRFFISSLFINSFLLSIFINSFLLSYLFTNFLLIYQISNIYIYYYYIFFIKKELFKRTTPFFYFLDIESSDISPLTLTLSGIDILTFLFSKFSRSLSPSFTVSKDSIDLITSSLPSIVSLSGDS